MNKNQKNDKRLKKWREKKIKEFNNIFRSWNYILVLVLFNLIWNFLLYIIDKYWLLEWWHFSYNMFMLIIRIIVPLGLAVCIDILQDTIKSWFKRFISNAMFFLALIVLIFYIYNVTSL